MKTIIKYCMVDFAKRPGFLRMTFLGFIVENYSTAYMGLETLDMSML